MKLLRRLFLSLAAVFVVQGLPNVAAAPVLKTEFIDVPSPTPSCHASTICETRGGLAAAWFGGTREGANDVGIWFTRTWEGSWRTPVQVATGNDDPDGPYPCWNPVLFQPKNGPLYLFYKVGPRPSNWWGRVLVSHDQGATWMKSRRLPKDYLGPVRCKPVQLWDGLLLMGSSTEDAGWRVHMECLQSSLKGLDGTWRRTRPLNDALEFGAIQPTILVWRDTQIQILCRSRQGVVTECWSSDRGSTWSKMARTSLPNPNSGIDAVMLREGMALLIYNHTESGRAVLNLSLSKNGRDWQQVLTLENEQGEFSYPAIIQSGDGFVHATYTWKRQHIKHVVIDPWHLQPAP